MNLVADRADLSFGHDHPVGDQHDLIADDVHLLEDVARDDDVLPLAGPASEEVDRLRANKRVETVQRLVQDNDIGIVSDGLRQPHPLPHTLGVRPRLCGSRHR